MNKAESNRINGKKGGRPKGKKDPQTLEREKVAEHLRQRAMAIADRLFNAQTSLALGQQFLYRIDKEFIKTGTNKKTGEDTGYYKKLKPVMVTSEFEIEEYLNGLVEGDEDDDQDPLASYYYITTKEPVNQAVDSIYDRTLGKPKESIELIGAKKILVDF